MTAAAAKFILFICLTVNGAQNCAEHEFSNQNLCESFKYWFVKNEQAHDVRAFCVTKQEFDI